MLAGQERFRTLGSAFYRGADAVLMLYSTTAPASLESLRFWYDEFRTKAPVLDDDFPWIAVGTKTDLVAPHGEGVEVDTAEALLRELLPVKKEPTGRGGYAVDEPAEEYIDAIPSHLSTSSGNRIDIIHLPTPRPRRLSPSLHRASNRTSTSSDVFHTPPTSTLIRARRPSESGSQNSYNEIDLAAPPDVLMINSPPRLPHGFTTSSRLSYINPNERLFSTSDKSQRPSSPSPSSSNDSPTPLPPQPTSAKPDYTKHGIKHFLTSAKTGAGVQSVLEYCVRRVLDKQERRESAERDLRALREENLLIMEERKERSSKGEWRPSCCT